MQFATCDREAQLLLIAARPRVRSALAMTSSVVAPSNLELLAVQAEARSIERLRLRLVGWTWRLELPQRDNLHPLCSLSQRR